MTIQTVPRFLVPNAVPVLGATTTSLASTSQACATIDAANEKMAVLCHCPVSGSLTDIAFRTQTVSVTSGPLNFDVRLETVVSGRPSGTLWATNTNGNASIATTDDNVWKTVTLTAAATVTKGEPIGIVIKAPGSGTFSVTWGGFTAVNAGSGQFPCLLQDIAPADGTYDTTAVVDRAPSLAVKVDGVWWRIEPWAAVDAMQLGSFSNASGIDEVALRFVCPFGMRACGAVLYTYNMAAGAYFTVSLWPDSASSQTDADSIAQVAMSQTLWGGTTQDGIITVFFQQSPTLAINEVYWLGMRADTATAVTMVGVQATSVALMEAMVAGASGYEGQRKWTAGSAPAWTTFTTTTPLFALIVDGVDTTSGGLSAIGHAG